MDSQRQGEGPAIEHKVPNNVKGTNVMFKRLMEQLSMEILRRNIRLNARSIRKDVTELINELRANQIVGATIGGSNVGDDMSAVTQKTGAGALVVSHSTRNSRAWRISQSSVKTKTSKKGPTKQEPRKNGPFGPKHQEGKC